MIFISFSAFRGHKARKYVSELKSEADKRETNMIYFFQQVRIFKLHLGYFHF